ncbi:minor tail protein [Arthrobacter phage Sporto]|nr:minor tail protein [Arthrobacter phage Sporto]
MGQMTFTGNGSYKIDVDAAVVSQDINNKTSTIYWRTLVIKNGTTGHRAWGNTGSSGWADSSVGGNPDLWYNGNMEYNFQNGSMTGTFTIAEGTFVVGHRSDGNAEYFVNSGLDFTILGHADAGTGWRSLPQLAQIPDATTPIALDEITQRDMRYRFSGNGNGGAPILEWQIGYGTSSTTPMWFISSGGTSTIPNLAPATMWYAWSRGRNAVGWGPWSSRLNARTLAGARVRQSGVWKEAIPYVKQNGSWKLAQPYSKVNGIWRKSI